MPKYICLALAAGALLAAPVSSKEAAPRPNIVLVFADDLGFSHTSPPCELPIIR